MLAYDEYLKRLQKNVDKVRRLRTALLIALPVFCAIAVLTVSFLYFYGTITEDVQCPDFFIGEEPAYRAKALFCEPEYLFYKEGQKDTAAKELPSEAGVYIIEAVGGNGKGERRHSTASFAVLPLTLRVTPSNGICAYGEESKNRELLCTGLAAGDRVADYAYDYRYRYPALIAEIAPDIGSLKIVDRDGKDVTSHYEIFADSISLPFEKTAISVGLRGEYRVPYDGEKHSYEKLEVVSGALLPGDSLEYTVPEGQYSRIGSYTVPPESVRIVNKDGEDRTAYYDVMRKDVALSIEKRNLTVKSSDAAVPYFQTDGFVPSYSVSGDGLLPGHRLTVNFAPIKQEIGAYSLIFTVSVTDEKTGASVEELYDLKLLFGKLNILREPITVRTGSATKTYDGKDFYCREFELLSGNLSEGHMLTVRSYSTCKYAGQCENVLRFRVFDEKGNDVTDLYSIETQNGTLSVLPEELTFRSLDYSKEYDGTELYGYEYELVSGTIYDDIYFRMISLSSQTEVGKTLNTFSVNGVAVNGEVPKKSTEKSIFWKNGSFSLASYSNAKIEVVGSYRIHCEYGTLEVTPGKLIITGVNAQKRYDGTPLTCSKYSFNVAKLPKNCKLDIRFSGTITEVGKTENPFEAVVRDISGNDVTEKYFYSVQKEYGTLTVYPGGGGGSGESGESGGSGTEEDVSSEVLTDPMDEDLSVVFQLKSNCPGLIYLKNKDYNLYRNKNWTDETSSLMKYYTGKCATSNNPLGFDSRTTSDLYEMTLSMPGNQVFSCPVAPEYVYLENYYKGNISTTLGLNGKNKYSFLFFKDGKSLDNSLVKTGGVRDVTGYRKAVVSKYGDLPNSFFRVFTAMSDTDPDFRRLKTSYKDADTFADAIAQYLGSICSYSMNFPEVPAYNDPVEYFLTESHQGICNHFASAATLMCRYFGLPARYTTGYVAFSVPNQSTDILANQAHAWCEYYDTQTDTWKVLEATKYAVNLDEDLSALADLFRTEEKAKKQKTPLIVTVQDASFSFDGREHSASRFDLKGTLNPGDKFQMLTYTGSQKYVGSSACGGVPAVYSSNGKLVTDEYDITVIPGTLTVTPYEQEGYRQDIVYLNTVFEVNPDMLLGIAAESVEISVLGLPETEKYPPFIQKYPLSLESGTVLKFIALLPYEKYGMEFEILHPDLNGDGVDEFVSSKIHYEVTTAAGTTVVPMGVSAAEAANMGWIPKDGQGYAFPASSSAYRMLDIEMLSGERSYNGEAFTVDSCAIIGGSLREGEILTCVGRRAVKYAGDYKNTCVSVYILNKEGIDVTSDYLVRAFEGTLRVLPVNRTFASGTEYVPLFASVTPDSRSAEYSGISDFTNMQVNQGSGVLLKDRKLIPLLPGKKDVSLESGCDLNQDGIIDIYLIENITYVSRITWWQMGIAALLVAVPLLLTLVGMARKKHRQDTDTADDSEKADDSEVCP